MKVFLIDPSLFTRPYDDGLARGLASHGADVTLISRPLRQAEALEAVGYRFLPLFYRNAETGDARLSGARLVLKGLEHLYGMARLGQLVRRERPDIIHVQWLVLPVVDSRLYQRFARLGIPVVYTAHNSVAFHNRPSSALQLVGQNDSLRRFSHYVTHTEPTARHLEATGIPRERVTVIPTPVLEFKVKAAARPARVREDATRILLFGFLKPYKGLDVLVEAGLALARRRRDFQIVVAGRPGFDLAPLQARVAAAGADDCFLFDLRYLPDDEMAAYLDAADIIAFPYHEIDTSGALTVAAERRKAIVASAVGLFAEPEIGPFLRLVPPGDAPALEQAFERLLDDPAERQALADRSPRLGDALLSWPAFGQAHLDLYRSLVGTAR